MRAKWIDAHHHLWQYRASEFPWMDERMVSLRRDFNVDELEALAGEHGVGATVAVQARQSVRETEFLLDVAETHRLVQGVVGWVPLIDANVGAVLEGFAGRTKLKGVRHVLHDEADDTYMLRTDFNRGIALLPEFGLRYELLIIARHLAQTIEFVDRHPRQPFIVDHVAKPEIAHGSMDPWRGQMRELARRPNVSCKLSGMVTEAGWTAWTGAQLEPYFEVVLEAFGPDRLMFGSDWPVVTLASDYGRWLHTVDGWLERMSAGEAEAIRFRTAARVYGLQIGDGEEGQ